MTQGCVVNYDSVFEVSGDVWMNECSRLKVVKTWNGMVVIV